MLIAGIDGSTTSSGICIFKDGEYVEHTLIDLKKNKDSEKRLAEMMCLICKYLDKFDIDKIIMEKSILKTNISTVQMLSMLSGGILLYAAQHNIQFENPVPSVWRRRTGIEQSKNVRRDVLKQEAVAAVKQEYGIDVTDDEAESILIARSGFDIEKINIKSEDVMWGE